MQIKEAIILAGGFGTRLRSAVPDLPKCLAPVAGRPFLFYVINALRAQGVERFIFSLGYMHEEVERYLHDHFPTLDYDCAIEGEPLGTGGAILLSCTHSQADHIMVANGDTLFETYLADVVRVHQQTDATCTLALKPMENFDRYGVVTVNSAGIVEQFHEKKYYAEGLINGGIYLLNRKRFLSLPWPSTRFSFEKDFLEKQVSTGTIAGAISNGYFIDIGIPEDFERAGHDLLQPPLDLHAIDNTWSLFLDRDGVINEDKPGSYIFTPDEFHFMNGGPQLFSKLAARFGRILIATNQRGVGRGLMTEDTLTTIHDQMKAAINAAGGRIDGIYYATALENNDPLRKPNPGMALLARRDFPDIDPFKCIMIGNNISDMQFGRNAGMYTVFLTTTNKEIRLPHPDIDLIFPDLAHFVEAL